MEARGVWTGEDAREKKLKTMLKPKVLHIATHEFFEKDVDTYTYLTQRRYLFLPISKIPFESMHKL